MRILRFIALILDVRETARTFAVEEVVFAADLLLDAELLPEAELLELFAASAFFAVVEVPAVTDVSDATICAGAHKATHIVAAIQNWALLLNMVTPQAIPLLHANQTLNTTLSCVSCSRASC